MSSERQPVRERSIAEIDEGWDVDTAGPGVQARSSAAEGSPPETHLNEIDAEWEAPPSATAAQRDPSVVEPPSGPMSEPSTSPGAGHPAEPGTEALGPDSVDAERELRMPVRPRSPMSGRHAASRLAPERHPMGAKRKTGRLPTPSLRPVVASREPLRLRRREVAAGLFAVAGLAVFLAGTFAWISARMGAVGTVRVPPPMLKQAEGAPRAESLSGQGAAEPAADPGIANLGLLPEPTLAAAPSGVGPSNGVEPSGSARAVKLRVFPFGTRILDHGRLVGETEVAVEVVPGTRRVLELQYPGYTSRRLVVDGSEPEMRVGLLRSVPRTEDVRRPGGDASASPELAAPAGPAAALSGVVPVVGSAASAQ